MGDWIIIGESVSAIVESLNSWSQFIKKISPGYNWLMYFTANINTFLQHLIWVSFVRY